MMPLSALQPVEPKTKACQDAAVEIHPKDSCQDDEVHNKTYCKHWVMSEARTENISLDSAKYDVTSTSLQDLTSVSRNVQCYKEVNKDEYFYSKRRTQKKPTLSEKETTTDSK